MSSAMGETSIPRRGWRSFLGVDGAFLVTAAAHGTVIVALAVLARIERFVGLAFDDLWMCAIGVTATSASLLAAWMIAAPGCLAIRSLWAIALVHAVGFLTPHVLNRSEGFREITFVVIAAAALLAATLAVVSVMAARLAFGWRITTTNALPTTHADAKSQFRIADMMLFMVVAAVLVSAEKWYMAIAPIFFSIGRSLEAEICFAIRFAATQCGVIAVCGVWFLLADRCRITATVAIAIVATLLAITVPVRIPVVDSWEGAVRTYGVIGFASLLLTLGTPLPLRAANWRIQRTRPTRHEGHAVNL